jgi:hypothetical protein
VTAPNDRPATRAATGAAIPAGATVDHRGGPRARYESAVAPGDQPRTGTLDGLSRRRWATIVPRALVLLVVTGALTALGIGIVVVVAGLVLAATAG